MSYARLLVALSSAVAGLQPASAFTDTDALAPGGAP